MLLLLPWICLALIFLHLAGTRPNARREPPDFAGAFLAAVVLWGTFLLLLTEVLSLFEAITREWVALAWAICLVLALASGLRAGALPAGWRRMIQALRDLDRVERAFLVILAALCLVLFLLAWLSPPNNVDSQIYHMGRVVHWAQNHSLRAYAATNFGQNTKPIWAEAAILTLRVLWGSDRPANLVQWFSMLTCLAAAIGLARLLGAHRRGQLLAAAFAFSIPLGVLEATSTQNDYAAAMWVACLAYFATRLKKTPSGWFDVALIGLSLGLGMLTKGTFYAYAFPVLVWLFVPQLWRAGVLRAIAQGLAVGALAFLLNLGYWGRNIASYGGPFGSPGGLPLVFTQLLAPRIVPSPAATQSPTAATMSPTPATETAPAAPPASSAEPRGSPPSTLLWFTQRLAQNLGQNSVMPFHALTSVAWAAMRRLPWLFDAEYVDSLAGGMWNHEDTAGSPVHLLLGLAAVAALILMAIRRREIRLAAGFSVVAVACFAMLGLISYSVELFGVRYQLPFFVLCAPLVGAAATALSSRSWHATILACVLVSLAVPYVLLNNTRPVIGWRPKTRVGSVFTAPKLEVMYALVPGWQDEHAAVVELVLGTSCREVGLQLAPSTFDYPWWWLLEAPQSGVKIRNLGMDPPPFASDPESSIAPCAVICTTCQGKPTAAGLPLVMDYGSAQLYMAAR